MTVLQLPYHLHGTLGGFIIIQLIYRKKKANGEIFSLYMLWYGFGRGFIEMLRTDSLYLFDWTFMGEPIRVSQALSIVMVVVATVLLVYNIKIKKHSPEELLVNQVAAVQEAAAAAENLAGEAIGEAAAETVETAPEAPAELQTEESPEETEVPPAQEEREHGSEN